MEDYKKKYEDLIASLKKAKDDEMVRDDRFCVVIDNIVPKLKESEDERIRKDIVEYLKSQGASRRWDFNTWVAWLEKQKPVEWSEEDETALQDTLWCIEQARKQAKDENDMGTCWFAERWLKTLKGRVQPQQKTEWSEEDEKMILTIISDGVRKVGLDEGQISWLKSIKPQPKQEWSKDDENAIVVIQDIIRYSDKIGANIYTNEVKEKLFSWLKSIKDRYTWKPSEEQLKALKLASDKDWDIDGNSPLYTLYNDLKKL